MNALTHALRELDNLRQARDRHAAEVRRLDSLIRCWQEQLPRLGSARPAPKRECLTVRAAIDGYLAAHPTFRIRDLIATVREELPQANDMTIRAEVSRGVAYGVLESVRRGEYRRVGGREG